MFYRRAFVPSDPFARSPPRPPPLAATGASSVSMFGFLFFSFF